MYVDPYTCMFYIVDLSDGSKGGAPGIPPMAQNFLNFMQFFGKFWQNCRLAPPPREILDLPLIYVCTETTGMDRGGGCPGQS